MQTNFVTKNVSRKISEFISVETSTFIENITTTNYTTKINVLMFTYFVN